MTLPDSGWLKDPTGRFHFRFWDGSRWSDHVSNGDDQSMDPFERLPSSAEMLLEGAFREQVEEASDYLIGLTALHRNARDGSHEEQAAARLISEALESVAENPTLAASMAAYLAHQVVAWREYNSQLPPKWRAGGSLT